MNTPALPNKPSELIETESRHAQLRHDRGVVETELRALEAKLWRETTLDDAARDAVAERLAAGELEATGQGVVPEQLEILRSRLDLIQRADRKVAVRLAEQRERYNRSIAGAWRPQHKEAAQRIARALRELADANRAEQKIRGKAPNGQLPPMDFPNIGQLGASGGPAKFWMEHARRYGYLTEQNDAQPLPEAAY